MNNSFPVSAFIIPPQKSSLPIPIGFIPAFQEGTGFLEGKNCRLYKCNLIVEIIIKLRILMASLRISPPHPPAGILSFIDRTNKSHQIFQLSRPSLHLTKRRPTSLKISASMASLPSPPILSSRPLSTRRDCGADRNQESSLSNGKDCGADRNQESSLSNRRDCGADRNQESSLFCENFEEWMRDSVVDIVKNLKKAPILVSVHSEIDDQGNLKSNFKTEKAIEENWLVLKGQWKRGEIKSPDGIIYVEELMNEEEEEEEEEEEGVTRTWGVLVQGKGRVGVGPACYLLKTCRVGAGLGMGLFCTHFCLVRVQSFKKSAMEQLKDCWLLK